jgi:hypothetical protein
VDGDEGVNTRVMEKRRTYDCLVDVPARVQMCHEYGAHGWSVDSGRRE